MTIKTFWNDGHPLSAKFHELYENLVPDSGNCDSLQGELLRAANKINYDWFNNGWGCNNWSGAVNFIRQNYEKLPDMPDVMFIEQLKKELDFVYQYSHGEPHSLKYDDKACMSVTKIQELVVNALLANPVLIKNDTDMYSLQEMSYTPDHYDEDYESQAHEDYYEIEDNQGEEEEIQHKPIATRKFK